MNRLLAILAVTVIVATLLLLPNCIVDMVPDSAITDITIYCHSSTVSAVHNGVLCEVECQAYNYSSVFSCCSGVEGVAITVDSSKCTLQQLLDYMGVSGSTTAGKYSNSLYGYSAKLGGGIIIDNRLVNIHIVVRGTQYIVGTPILLGSY